jgi:cation transporter-like permease
MRKTNSIGKIMLVTLFVAFVASVIVEIVEHFYGADGIFTVVLCAIPVVFIWCCATIKA